MAWCSGNASSNVTQPYKAWRIQPKRKSCFFGRALVTTAELVDFFALLKWSVHQVQTVAMVARCRQPPGRLRPCQALAHTQQQQSQASLTVRPLPASMATCDESWPAKLQRLRLRPPRFNLGLMQRFGRQMPGTGIKRLWSWVQPSARPNHRNAPHAQSHPRAKGGKNPLDTLPRPFDERNAST